MPVWCASTHLQSTVHQREARLTATAYVLEQQRVARERDAMVVGSVVDVRTIPALRSTMAQESVVRCGVKRSRRMMAHQSQWLRRHQQQFSAAAEEHGPADRSFLCALPNHKNTQRVQNPLFIAPRYSSKKRASKNFTVLMSEAFDQMRLNHVTEQANRELDALSKTFNRAILQRAQRFGAAAYEMQNVAVANGNNHLQPVKSFYQALCAAAADNPCRWEVTKQQFLEVATKVAGMRKVTAAQLFTCLDPYDTARIRLMHAVVPIFLAYRPELHQFEAVLQCTRQDIAFNHLQHLYKMYADIRGGMAVDDLKEILACCLTHESQRHEIAEAINLVSKERPSRNKILQTVLGYENKLLTKEELMEIMRRSPQVLRTTSDLMQGFVTATSQHVAFLRQAARNVKR